MAQGDQARVICLFERAIKNFCLVVDLWIQYTNYLDFKTKGIGAPIILETYMKATRNCYWSGLLWSGYIRALEHFSKSSEIPEIFEKALASGFQTAQDFYQVFQSYIDYLLRSTKKSQGFNFVMKHIF